MAFTLRAYQHPDFDQPCFQNATDAVFGQLPGNELPGLKRMIQGSFASTYPDTAIPTVTMLLYFSAS